MISFGVTHPWNDWLGQSVQNAVVEGYKVNWHMGHFPTPVAMFQPTNLASLDTIQLHKEDQHYYFWIRIYFYKIYILALKLKTN